MIACSEAFRGEVPRRSPRVQEPVVVIGVAARHIGVGDVGQQPPGLVPRLHRGLHCDLNFLLLISKDAACFDQRSPTRGLLVFGKLADGLHTGGVLVHPAPHGFFILQEAAVALVELDQALDGRLGPVALREVFEHPNPAVAQGGGQQIRLGTQELDVQHGGRR